MKFLKPFLFFLFLFSFTQASAATLNVVPAKQNVNVGENGSISILVSSPGEAINAVSGILSFPKNLIQILSVSKADSLMNFWVNEPSFSNSQGSLSFEGVIMNPGFTGSGGKILKVNFKAKQKGEAKLVLSNASVLANDGNGTNVLEKLNQGTVTIGENQVKVKNLPKTPIMTSETHEDQTKWYSNKDIKVGWQIPSDVTNVYSVLNNKIETTPNNPKGNPKNLFQYQNLKDGIWYVHTRFKNTLGFGPTGHFKINIDTTPPESFSITESDSKEQLEARISFAVAATDLLSGIDKYTFSFDNNPPIDWVDDGNHVYTTDILSPGPHLLSAFVYDKAGNNIKTELSFEIKNLPKPEITKYKEFIKENEEYEIGGIAFPKSNIKVYIDNFEKNENEKTLETITDEKGNFNVSGENLPFGTYNLYAKSYLDSKYESAPSNFIKITSSPTGFNWIIFYIKLSFKWIISLISSLFSKYILIFGIVIILCLLLLFLIILMIRKYHKKSLPKNAPVVPKYEVVDGIRPSSSVINHAINTQQAILEKIKSGNNFTIDEHHFLMQLRRDLNYIDSINKPKK